VEWVGPLREEYDSVWYTILSHYDRRDIKKQDLPAGFFEDLYVHTLTHTVQSHPQVQNDVNGLY
jgi:hypothetical protein